MYDLQQAICYGGTTLGSCLTMPWAERQAFFGFLLLTLSPAFVSHGDNAVGRWRDAAAHTQNSNHNDDDGDDRTRWGEAVRFAAPSKGQTNDPGQLARCESSVFVFRR